MTARRIFAAPAAIGLVSAIGLIAALIGDDLWDVLSWATLGLPIALIAALLVHAARRDGSVRSGRTVASSRRDQRTAAAEAPHQSPPAG